MATALGLSALQCQELNLSKCSALQALPESLSQLPALQKLDLSESSALWAPPEIVGNLDRDWNFRR